jgi:hypothetical protein
VIYKKPKAASLGIAQAIVIGETCPLQISIDQGKLYFSTLFGAIKTASSTGGLVSVAVANADTGRRFAVAGGSIGFVQSTDSQEDLTRTLAIGRRSPMSAPKILVKTQTLLAHDPPNDLGPVAVDATATYYVSQSAEKVGVHPWGSPMWSATGTLRRVSAF